MPTTWRWALEQPKALAAAITAKSSQVLDIAGGLTTTNGSNRRMVSTRIQKRLQGHSHRADGQPGTDPQRKRRLTVPIRTSSASTSGHALLRSCCISPQVAQTPPTRWPTGPHSRGCHRRRLWSSEAIRDGFLDATISQPVIGRCQIRSAVPPLPSKAGDEGWSH